MSGLSIPVVHPVAQRLAVLAQLYQQGPVSDLTQRTVTKLLAYEVEVCRAQLRQLHTDLADFEQRYTMSTAEFYPRFQAGQTDDRMDFVEWASLAQMAESLRARLRLLTAEEMP